MTPLFQSADLFCQPNSGIEPFGITFIEALYAGLPVIGTNLGGPAEIVTPNCGDLLEPNHPEGLAECILNWMDSQKKRLLVRESGPQRAHQLCDPTARMQEMHTTLVGWLKAQD
jgi:glycosyltransferase involved in cell wall biosynthesis